jgi:hypothetical protein
MRYVVTKAFTDANSNSADKDGNLHIYWEGDAYPCRPYAGAQTKLRLKELVDGGYIRRDADEGADTQET